jgi:uncharacterized protein (TIGR02147 family)
MQNQVNIQRILKSRYSEIRAKNSRYSIRAFSRKVGVSAGTLSLIMLGKRNASPKLARKIADNLALDPHERSEIVPQYIPKMNTSQEQSEDDYYLQLSSAQFDVISEWYYFAILNLINTNDFIYDNEWIANRLGLTSVKVGKAIATLKKLELVKEEEKTLVRSSSKYRTTDDVTNLALKSSHYETLSLASDALDVNNVEERDFTWLTVAFDTKKMKQVKEKIRIFQDELMEFIEEDAKPTEVYRLAMQLFPLTKLNKKNKEKIQ